MRAIANEGTSYRVNVVERHRGTDALGLSTGHTTGDVVDRWIIFGRNAQVCACIDHGLVVDIGFRGAVLINHAGRTLDAEIAARTLGLVDQDRALQRFSRNLDISPGCDQRSIGDVGHRLVAKTEEGYRTAVAASYRINLVECELFLICWAGQGIRLIDELLDSFVGCNIVGQQAIKLAPANLFAH